MIHAAFELEQGSIYLTDCSPRDAKWKELKPQNLKVAHLYAGTVYDKYYQRMDVCSGFLKFDLVSSETGETAHKLQSAHFCRVRHCPICQWRCSLMWRSRTIRAMTRMLADHPGKRFIYLTISPRNCELQELSDTIACMNQSWHRLLKRPQFKAVGWLRSLEVTQGTKGDAHPHFHALLMVNPGYFRWDYLNQKDWIALWRSCARLDYDPSLRVNVVKPRGKKTTDISDTQPGIDEGLLKAIRYTLKYSTKPEDWISTDTSVLQNMQAWLVGLTEQMRNKRTIATGGIFKRYLKESEPDNLIVDEGNIDTSELENAVPLLCYEYDYEGADYEFVYAI